MKKIVLLCNFFFYMLPICGQTQIPEGFVPGNRTMSASLEKNILFNAATRYKVTQSGLDGFSPTEIAELFDCSMAVHYTWNKPVTAANPLVITIENLPNVHTQVASWIGFSTRAWAPQKFKIEGYNSYADANSWVVLADVSGNQECQYATSVVGGAYTKLRYTFYEGCQSSYAPIGMMGLSELFFIHPEAAQAYDGLFLKDNGRKNIDTNEIHFISNDMGYGIDNTDPYTLRKVHDSGNISHLDLNLNDDADESFRIYGNSCAGYSCGTYSGNLYHSFDASGNVFHAGNVGIGTQHPTYKLDVIGTIRAKEVLVNLDGGADFVFEKGYKLPTIEHVANYVQENKHLPDIPSANEMVKNGVSMGDMQVKLLQKVEELTLYAIEQNKSKKELEAKLAKQENQYNALLEKVEMLTKQIENK